METIEYGNQIRDSLVLHLNTQTTSSILLNGEYKSKVFYDLRSYLDFENDDTIDYVTVSMPHVVMTNSNYIINEYNNKIILRYGELDRIYTIPQGNYIKSTFVAYMQSSGILPPELFTITASQTTNRFRISITELFTSTYGDINPWGFVSGTTCDYIWGFRTEIFSEGVNLDMPRSMNFLPIPRFLFHANILSNGLILTRNSAVGASDILAAVPNLAKLNSQIIYENYGGEFLVNSQANMSGLMISITDDDNRLINFNGISCYFDLKFNIFRRSILRPLRFDSLVKKIQETKRDVDSSVEVVE